MREQISHAVTPVFVCLTLFLAGGVPTSTAAEFQVNTFTTYNQSSPAVAVDATGGFVVVWESESEDYGGYYGVFGRRYDSSGAAQGDEFHVNTFTKSRQGAPAVAADGAGNFVVVWSSEEQDGDSYGIFGQRYDSAGNPQGGEFKVNIYTTRSQGDPSVAADEAGNFVVAWTGYGEDDYSGVFGQRFDSSGSAQGPEFIVNTYTTGRQDAPAVAADEAGNFVVVWSSYGQTGEYYFGVFGQRYDSAGNAQGGEFQVNQSTVYYAGEFAPSPAVAKDAAGNFVVVWNSYDYDYFDVLGRRYDSAGTPQGAGEFRVNTKAIGDLYPGKPSVAADASGVFVVVWENYVENSGYYGVFGQRYDNKGAAQGDEFQVNETNVVLENTKYFCGPAIAAGSTGRFVVVWDSYGQDGSGYGVLGVAMRCGNGVLDQGEQCDDGNTTPGDGCDENCRACSGIVGDTNLDCDVSIVELQTCIAMFLGLVPVHSCVDSDGNGGVGVVELQSCIAGFLDLLACP